MGQVPPSGYYDYCCFEHLYPSFFMWTHTLISKSRLLGHIIIICFIFWETAHFPMGCSIYILTNTWFLNIPSSLHSHQYLLLPIFLLQPSRMGWSNISLWFHWHFLDGQLSKPTFHQQAKLSPFPQAKVRTQNTKANQNEHWLQWQSRMLSIPCVVDSSKNSSIQPVPWKGSHLLNIGGWLY